MRRAITIDLLRGLAIIGMVLSGQMLWNAELPAWMFHSQVPPPSFTFNPAVPGITWVDLVFPFFLFSMGAAFPLAMRKRLSGGASTFGVAKGVICRWMLLALFAIALGNLRSGALGDLPAWSKALMQLLVWGLFGMMFIRFDRFTKSQNTYLHIAGALLVMGLMIFCHYVLATGATIYRSDVIILVLANMALFGSAVWWFTRDNLTIRLGILAIVVALKIGSSVEGSWNESLWNWSPAVWLFRFDFLKYLCIIIPGTIVGDLIESWLRKPLSPSKPCVAQLIGGATALALVGVNLWGLFSRHTTANLLLTLCLGALTLCLLRREELMGKIARWGFYWLALGLILEAFEGGIRKDYATLSYYFVTAGLASMVLVAAHLAAVRWNVKYSWLTKCGQNPMVAYTAAGFVILPVLILCGLDGYLAQFAELTPWCGFYRGVLVTALVMLLTVAMTNKKIFWRT